MIGAPVRAESTNMTEMMKGDAIQDVADTTRTVLVWDPLVRSSHWGLVAAFAVAWLAADEVQPLHESAGYAVAVDGVVAPQGLRAAIGPDSEIRLIPALAGG